MPHQLLLVACVEDNLAGLLGAAYDYRTVTESDNILELSAMLHAPASVEEESTVWYVVESRSTLFPELTTWSPSGQYESLETARKHKRELEARPGVAATITHRIKQRMLISWEVS